MADVWDQTVGNSNWKLNLYRDFNDWEVTLAVALLNSLQKERVSSESDKISWKGPIGCSFSVNEAVKVLSSRGTPLFPIKGIWVHGVPIKATFFAWEATWSKILTLDKLQRRGWQGPIVAISVVGMRNLPIIFCCIVQWSATFGFSFSP